MQRVVLHVLLHGITILVVPHQGHKKKTVCCGMTLQWLSQATACDLLGSVIIGLLSCMFINISKGQGCALVQAMDCLAKLINQQQSIKQRFDSNPPCFRLAQVCMSVLM